jgi:hypothetical protein
MNQFKEKKKLRNRKRKKLKKMKLQQKIIDIIVIILPKKIFNIYHLCNQSIISFESILIIIIFLLIF